MSIPKLIITKHAKDMAEARWGCRTIRDQEIAIHKVYENGIIVQTPNGYSRRLFDRCVGFLIKDGNTIITTVYEPIMRQDRLRLRRTIGAKPGRIKAHLEKRKISGKWKPGQTHRYSEESWRNQD